ncbi:MAG: hypothetical protein JW946_02575 [Candidatus Omnitrophica bacterium]|nr:hypothetical protein [Candidatus Omnitrophota bacterium]
MNQKKIFLIFVFLVLLVMIFGFNCLANEVSLAACAPINLSVMIKQIYFSIQFKQPQPVCKVSIIKEIEGIHRSAVKTSACL